MPHRRTPRGYVLNLLQRRADFDVKTRESINSLSAACVAVSLESEFPGVDAEAVLADEGLASEGLIEGLVLSDRFGRGVLQSAGKPEILSIDRFMVLQREEALKSKRAL